MGFIGEIFGKPKVKTPEPPKPPSLPDEKALEAQERQKALDKKRRTVGTLLTSSSGLEDNAPSSGKTLLGS